MTLYDRKFASILFCLVLLLFISWFVCTRRWNIDKEYFMQIFHANQTSICIDPHQYQGKWWYRQKYLIPSDFFYWPFQGGASFVDLFCCLCFVFVCHAVLSVPYGLVVICWGSSWLSCMWYFLVFLSFSHMVSWVRCCIWLYRFLIFAIFFTFKKLHLLVVHVIWDDISS